MNYTETGEKIRDAIVKNPKDFVAYADLTDLLYAWAKEDDITPYGKVSNILTIQNFGLRRVLEEEDFAGAEKMRRLIFRTLKFSAPRNFDHYMQALEYDRKPKERFYLPRRETLRKHVIALQALSDDKLDELFLSQPPRTGKTCLMTFFLTWIFGKNSEMSNLYCSVTDDLTKSFYKGVLEVITDPDTYKWNEIFPNAQLVAKDGDKETINIDRDKKYSSLTCRSLYGSLNGSCDAYGYLIADDLLSGIEEALNPARLKTAWTTTDNNLLSRAKESCKIIWEGTRWSLQDPIGTRIRALESNDAFRNVRYDVINIPALNDEDESNFQYKYGVGFSTDFYRRRRASFESAGDLASWNAQFQGQPIEREATVFTPDTMRYYNGELPDEEPIRIWAVCDPAFGGGDFVSVPIIYTYNKIDNYVHDVVFNKNDKTITQPLIAKKLANNYVRTIDIEVTKTTRSYAEGVANALEKIGYHCTISTHTAPQNQGKEYRILDRAPDIRQYFIFRDQAHRSKEYSMFMQNIFSFKVEGKNLHDDAPDSMGMAADAMFKVGKSKALVIERPF